MFKMIQRFFESLFPGAAEYDRTQEAIENFEREYGDLVDIWEPRASDYYDTI